ncbi:single-stranded DNA-binding protein [Flavobacterium sp. Sd200]|uniref:single-stranded DNA-binding protein n=1 Tax=Flavobacterium sp. Sd200 TaxID=2692211 RepID=UPI00137004A6|nr:single-stranded DNA-binding protein [Flavobacterium sp. Sd200]MXN90805.1 single-stranded DNA-binding protein [Flavobacterium sp. Sd200]
MEITGRLTANAQVRSYNGKDVVNFSIAVNDRYKDKEGNKVVLTDFFNCSYWLTAKVAPYLLKGGIVEVSGRVSAGAYMGNDGAPKASLNVNVNRITFHGGMPRGVESVTVHEAEIIDNKGQQYKEDEHDDLPF